MVSRRWRKRQYPSPGVDCSYNQSNLNGKNVLTPLCQIFALLSPVKRTSGVPVVVVIESAKLAGNVITLHGGRGLGGAGEECDGMEEGAGGGGD